MIPIGPAAVVKAGALMRADDDGQSAKDFRIVPT
jgi:hypothetical protein